MKTFHHIIYDKAADGLNKLYSRSRGDIERVLFEDTMVQVGKLMDNGFVGPALIRVMSYLERIIENLLNRIEDR